MHSVPAATAAGTSSRLVSVPTEKKQTSRSPAPSAPGVASSISKSPILPPADPLERSHWADSVFANVAGARPGTHRLTEAIDRVVLHPIAGSLLFAAVMVTFFQLIFAWATPAMDAIDVPYAVTGSTAMNFYAVPRMTRDIDVLIGPRRNELSLVARVLTEDFDADHEVILEALRATRMFQIFGKGVPVKLDVIPATAALAGPDMLRRAPTFHIDEQPIRVVSPEDLIVAKLYSARESESEMQMRDIANLLQSAKPDLEDVERLDRHARALRDSSPLSATVRLCSVNKRA